IPFSFATMTPNPADLWIVDSAGKRNGLQEKLLAIVQAINDSATSTYRAELWGYRMAIIAKSGPANKTPTGVVSAPNATLGAANFVANVRRYSLGVTGTSPFQIASVAADKGDDGNPFTLTELQGVQSQQTGLYALDQVD